MGILLRNRAILLVLTFCLAALAAFTAFAVPAAAAAEPSHPAASAAGGATAGFAPLDIPGWVILAPGAPNNQPWILVIDDPQCPYCMQLHLAIEKAREQGDPLVSTAVMATIPFPLAFHDQAAHVVQDAFCLEASGKERGWSAASYLDWLLVAPWRSEPGWKTVTIEELEKDGGFFDAHYNTHKVTSSRRRDFQTERARAEAACGVDVCRGDADCEKICAAQKSCRETCPAEGAGSAQAAAGSAGSLPAGSAQAAAGSAGSPPAGGGGTGAALTAREACLSSCRDKFVSARYRQFSKVHSACLLEEGPASAHGKTAAAYAWALAHKVPGTPTVYVGHPSIGFMLLGDSDNMSGFFVLLRSGLSEARSKLSASALQR